ncbi:MAG: C40 family peptidase [Firmicutes bacterium]|nr:C40 family peptidase [Bacillota bacterium]
MPALIEPIVTMYKCPDLLSETVSQAKMGEPIDIIEDKSRTDFCLIKTLWDNYTGFVQKKSVDKEAGTWSPEPSIITASLTNLVYSSPKVQAQIIARLPLGIKIKLLGSNKDHQPSWLNVMLCNGLVGFIQVGDICFPDRFKFNNLSSLRQSLVSWANKFEGATTYLWGGTSSFGIDCSGFVQHIYRLHDLPLERDASQMGQGKYLKNIKREDVLPGDLIFFKDYGHVGMAISHFSFIHATTHLKPVVQVSEIDSSNWLENTIQYSRYKF